jgi:hypothetical protein
MVELVHLESEVDEPPLVLVLSLPVLQYLTCSAASGVFLRRLYIWLLLLRTVQLYYRYNSRAII